MAVTVRGTDTADSGGVAVTSLNLTVPATAQTGDVGYLIADTANTSRTGVAPSGWTMVGGTHVNTTGLRAWLYRRDMTGAQAGTTITVGLSGTGVMTAGLIVFAGGDSSTEVIAGPTTDVGDNTTMSTVAVTPSVNNALLVHLASVRYTSLTTSGGTAPTGFTEVFDYDNAATTGTNGRHGVYCATKQLSGQSGVSQASVNGTWASTARDHTWAIALGPVASTSATVNPPAAAATAAATTPSVGAGSSVIAAIAAATALALVPNISASSTRPPPAATSSAQAVAPGVTSSASVSASVAQASGQAVTPGVASSATVAAVRALSTGQAVAPTVATGAVIGATRATATAQAIAPSVNGGGSVTVSAVAATATAQGRPPAVSAGATVAAIRATGTGSAIAPSVSCGASVQAATAMATAAALAPQVNADARVGAPTATAVASAIAPNITGGTDPEPVPTPASRTLIVAAEERALPIRGELRQHLIPSETRAFAIDGETRARTIPAEPRITEVT